MRKSRLDLVFQWAYTLIVNIGQILMAHKKIF